MSLLTNTSLKNIINITNDPNNSLQIIPYDENNLTPVGYDLTVGQFYYLNGKKYELKDNESLKVPSNGTVLIESSEKITMPEDKSISAMINSKVSLSCLGLSNISTTVDADWSGKLLIAIRNHSNKKVSMKKNSPFCTVVFFKNLSNATKSSVPKPTGRSDILVDSFMKQSKISLTTILVYMLPIVFGLLPMIIWWFYSADMQSYLKEITPFLTALIGYVIALIIKYK